MNRNRWIAGLLCIFLLFCTGCTKGEQKQTTTTQNSQPSSELFPTRRDDSQTRAEPYPTVKIPTSPDDPYAQIIKDLYEELAQSVSAEYNYQYTKFALYDIDGDGTQELLLSNWYAMWGYREPEFENEYESDEIGKTGILFNRFYYISNGKAVEMPVLNGLWDGAAGPTGGRDLLTNGVIRLYGGSPNYTSYAYFRYANGELSLLRVLRCFADTGRWLVTWDGDQSTRTKITEAEFNRLRAEIEGDAQVVEIDWKPLESYGRE